MVKPANDPLSRTLAEGTALPRVTISFCTQCRWMLRAAYYAQELLSTFGNTLGEVALQPSTGGYFRVAIEWVTADESAPMPDFYPTRELEANRVLETTEESSMVFKNKDGKWQRYVVLWDRKIESGFPDTKVLKQRVRDCVKPEQGLGHSDVGGKAKNDATKSEESPVVGKKDKGETQKEDGQSLEKKQTAQESSAVPAGKDDCETCL